VTEASAAGLRDFCWTPADFGLSPGDRQKLQVTGPAESAALIREVLAGGQGSPREIVVLNAAAALWTAGREKNPADCARLAAEAIDTGAARDLLEQLVKKT